MAKRCQQCREIIIAAKEKQEGEARKNANCLLEQIKQEEEERANREAMQARKRERKRMKRKAKLEKERQCKEPSQSMECANRRDKETHPSTEDHDNEHGSRSVCSSVSKCFIIVAGVRLIHVDCVTCCFIALLARYGRFK